MNHLLRLTETQEESIEKDERHAMLHKNARSNYRVLVDLLCYVSEMHKGAFKYYVIKEVGGWA